MGDVMPAGFRQGARSDGNGIDLGAQFGYHYHEQLDNDLRREPILDLQDTQFVEDFFENPNDPKVAASLSQRADSNLNPSMEDRNSFAVNYTFDQSANAGPINPASTMADSSSINYETHQGTLPFQSDNFQQFGGHHPAADNNEVLDTASSLMNLHAAQEGPYPLDNTMMAASWGNITGPSFTGNGPMPGNGGIHNGSRQPSNGSGYGFSAQHAELFLQQQQFHDMQTRMARAHQMQYGLPHVRTQSLSSDVNQFAAHAQSVSHPASSAGHQQHRIPLPRYNSDPYITGPPFGYNSAPSAAAYHGKEGNLMQVPFATQAQSSHVHSHAPHVNQPDQRLQHPNRMPHGFRGLNSTQSSPTDGLPPATTMSTPTQQHPAQWGALRLGGPRYVQEVDEEDALVDSHPRKRRRSHDDGDNDAEYEPEPRAQSTISKRGPKGPKVEPASDDEEVEPFTPAKRSTAKRRTASGSSPNSPAEAASPSNGASSSARRKSSAKSRQNLSDEQKRQNHIISEQKRRNVIKQGYHDLDNMVPILNSGKSGLSKAEQVKEIVTYLESLVTGNRLVEAKLQGGTVPNEYVDDAAGGGGGFATQ